MRLAATTATLLIAAAAGPGVAQAPCIALASETFTLPNGLRVILQPDTTAPIIATNISYHVGSAREKPGRTGFAHLFEHINRYRQRFQKEQIRRQDIGTIRLLTVEDVLGPPPVPSR